MLRQLLSAGDALVRTFTHDPLYQLTAATGRACTTQETPRSPDDLPRCGYQPPGPATPAPHNAPDLSIGYQEQYSYDPTGNLVSLDYRTSDGKQHWSRRYTYSPLASSPASPPPATSSPPWTAAAPPPPTVTTPMATSPGKITNGGTPGTTPTT